jgi:hypothetical protein
MNREQMSIRSSKVRSRFQNILALQLILRSFSDETRSRLANVLAAVFVLEVLGKCQTE